MAFTTVSGAGATDATSYIGTAGVDTLLLQNSTTPAFVGARASADTVTIQNFKGVQENVTVRGGQGDDTLNSNATNLTASLVNGNKDVDAITYQTVTSTTLYGGQGADVINVTTVNASVVNGNKDLDNLTVGTISGGSVYGGQGNDTIALTTISGGVVGGSNDDDAITLGGVTSAAVVNGNAGNDTLTIGAGVTAFTTSTVFGGAGDDTIAGAAAGAAVVVSGDAGNDTVTTGTDGDTLTGGAGTDTLTGNAGSDTLTGGTEADNFAIGLNIVNAADNLVDADTVVDLSLTQADSITGFGLTNLQLQAAVADVELAGNGAGAGIAANDVAVTGTVTFDGLGVADLAGLAATANIALVSNNYASDAAFQTAVRTGLTASGIFAANSAILAVYDDGVNSYLTQITTADGVTDDGIFDDGVVTRLATLNGVADATTLTAASAVWGAFVA